ncbi:hypothetical protein [Mucilaginibacter flavidus]|uniref:hypothetical protein n=1 Tax=Mucilaginibacter flavidus TaxID=2949309 RepID=UPI0020933FA5|nr:hypothetical protein [Mucilaginibacter flavidus]MCO5949279.1 hypothetical protein [Mucilaginibacter flavidus]
MIIKTNPYISALFPILSCIVFGCTEKANHSKPIQQHQQEANFNKIDFISFIGKHRNDTLDFYEELLADKPFVNVLEHSKFYFNDVLSFLNDGKFNTGQVAISICAMQNLDVHDYVKLCNTVLDLYNARKLPVTILDHAISPDFLQKRIIIDNYTNPEVIALINNTQNNKTINDPDLLNWLPDVLSGKSSKELKKFDEENASN